MLGKNHVVISEEDSAGFVPELWSEEIIKTYKNNLMMDKVLMVSNPPVQQQIRGREVQYVILDDIGTWDDAWSDSTRLNAG